jgi:hypothetical protein
LGFRFSAKASTAGLVEEHNEEPTSDDDHSDVDSVRQSIVCATLDSQPTARQTRRRRTARSDIVLTFTFYLHFWELLLPPFQFDRDGYHTANSASVFFKHTCDGPVPIYKLAGNLGFLRLRTKQILPRIFWPNYDLGDEKNSEDWYRRLCLLFVPFRSEAELKADHDTHEACFKAFL